MATDSGEAMKPETITDLERAANDYSDPKERERAARRLTDILASKVTSQEKPFFTRLRLGSDVVFLDSSDREELERQANLAQVAVMQCREHLKSIKCACLESFRAWYWSLQRLKPNAPLTLVASDLWDRVEVYAKTFERQSRTDSTLDALVTMVSNLADRNEGFPDWFGKRKNK